jgi:hypothetical protein
VFGSQPVVIVSAFREFFNWKGSHLFRSGFTTSNAANSHGTISAPVDYERKAGVY